MHLTDINKTLGNINLHLLDQILKGRLKEGSRILDVGCGEGRNLTYFLNHNFDVFGIDKNPAAIEMLHFIVKTKNRNPSHFQVGDMTSLPFQNGYFDLIIADAVLHFAKNEEDFESTVQEMIRVMKPSATLFISVATKEIGNEFTDKHFPIIKIDTTFTISFQSLLSLVDKFNLNYIEPPATSFINSTIGLTTLILSKQSIKD